jgi:hypothetical protein
MENIWLKLVKVAGQTWQKFVKVTKFKNKVGKLLVKV